MGRQVGRHVGRRLEADGCHDAVYWPTMRPRSPAPAPSAEPKPAAGVAREPALEESRRDAALAGDDSLHTRRPQLEATLLEGVDKDAKALNEDAFGPLAILQKFSSFDEALAEVNRSTFGLQAGIFTRDLFKMFDAWDRLEVGGVVINDVPSYRVDNMPYGGVKDSGLGREGIKFAMEDMTEIRNLVIRRG